MRPLADIAALSRSAIAGHAAWPGAFDLDSDTAYRLWRAHKLENYPSAAEDLIVELSDPLSLTGTERRALSNLLAKANMAIYRLAPGTQLDTGAVRALGAALGLKTLDSNPYADEDRVSVVSARPDAAAKGYIPYTNRALNWHTDGYYNPPERRIGAFIMHCVQPAEEGGANGLLDPEIVYLLLRDRDPGLVAALMDIQAMTVPPNTDEAVALRAEQTGPVFSVDARTGALHMRYTARTRSIRWKDAPELRAALEYLAQMLSGDCGYRYSYRLAAGEGLICNNVLHSRSAYTDVPGQPRVLYRARYHERAS